MGCDIHSFAEHKVDGKWIESNGDLPFDCRSYGIFAFLAGVRNYAHCECITGEPRGLPTDSEYLNTPLDKPEGYSYSGYHNGTATTVGERYTCDIDYHSHSHIYLKELLEFDYDKTFWNRRISRTTYNNFGGSMTNGASLAEEGEGTHETYREFLGGWFFDEIEKLKTLGKPEDVRVVMCFDN